MILKNLFAWTQISMEKGNLNQKKCFLKYIDFYLVTDSRFSKKGTLSDVKEAVEAGCQIIQYREKNKSTQKMIYEASEIKRICRNNAKFLVNDRIDIALAVDADGVHLGQNDMPIEIARKLLGEDKIIGLTVHNVNEAIEAENKGADYVGLGPIFDTVTKKVRRERADEAGDREAAALVHADVEHVLAADVNLDPASALGDDAAGVQPLLGGAGVFLEVHAGRAVKLRDDDALRAVDDELAPPIMIGTSPR